jgi:hypothetical protein
MGCRVKDDFREILLPEKRHSPAGIRKVEPRKLKALFGDVGHQLLQFRLLPGMSDEQHVLLFEQGMIAKTLRRIVQERA